MTSKRLFLKGMKEDLRHKVWMPAIFLLGNFLALPVMWLLRYSDVDMANTRALMGDMAALMVLSWLGRRYSCLQH